MKKILIPLLLIFVLFSISEAEISEDTFRKFLDKRVTIYVQEINQYFNGKIIEIDTDSVVFHITDYGQDQIYVFNKAKIVMISIIRREYNK